MTNKEEQTSMDRRRMVVKLMLGSFAGLAVAACGGGGGSGSSSEGSHDLRAALDRLQPGMNLEQVIAAVGWAPNDGSPDWDDGDEWLNVTINVGINGNPDTQITAAQWHGSSGDIRRSYI